MHQTPPSDPRCCCCSAITLITVLYTRRALGGTASSPSCLAPFRCFHRALEPGGLKLVAPGQKSQDASLITTVNRNHHTCQVSCSVRVCVLLVIGHPRGFFSLSRDYYCYYISNSPTLTASFSSQTTDILLLLRSSTTEILLNCQSHLD